MKWFWAWLAKRLTTPPRGTVVVDAEWVRSEELRPDRLGPDEDDIIDSDPMWRPPMGARRDPWRPTNSLGPL